MNLSYDPKIKYNYLIELYSMDVHPSRELVASGQRAGSDRKAQAHVRIWSTESLQTLYVFGMGELNVGVSAVAFSQLVDKIRKSHLNHNTLMIFVCFLLEWWKLYFGC